MEITDWGIPVPYPWPESASSSLRFSAKSGSIRLNQPLERVVCPSRIKASFRFEFLLVWLLLMPRHILNSEPPYFGVESLDWATVRTSHHKSSQKYLLLTQILHSVKLFVNPRWFCDCDTVNVVSCISRLLRPTAIWPLLPIKTVG